MEKATAQTTKESQKEKHNGRPYNRTKDTTAKERTKETAKEKERTLCQAVTFVGNLDILQEIVEQWSTTCQRQNKSKHKMQQDNGMINKMDTMPVGTTETLLVLPAPNSIHSNLHYQHPHHNNHKMDRKTIHQQYMQYIQWQHHSKISN